MLSEKDGGSNCVEDGLWPQEALDRVAHAAINGKLLVVVGAGVSVQPDSRRWTWSELLRELLRRAQNDENDSHNAPQLSERVGSYLEKGDLLAAASRLAEWKPKDWVLEQLRELLGDSSFRPTMYHQKLAELRPWAVYLTTNYDILLEDALKNCGGSPRVVYPNDPQGLGKLSPGDVFKLHGDVNHPDQIVFSPEDYKEVAHNNSNAWRTWLSAYTTLGEILICGYGCHDPHFRDVIDQVKVVLRRASGPIWLEKNSADVNDKAKDLGYTLVPFPDYDDAPQMVSKLVQRICELRADNVSSLLAKIPHLSVSELMALTGQGPAMRRLVLDRFEPHDPSQFSGDVLCFVADLVCNAPNPERTNRTFVDRVATALWDNVTPGDDAALEAYIQLYSAMGQPRHWQSLALPHMERLERRGVVRRGTPELARQLYETNARCVESQTLWSEGYVHFNAVARSCPLHEIELACAWLHDAKEGLVSLPIPANGLGDPSTPQLQNKAMFLGPWEWILLVWLDWLGPLARLAKANYMTVWLPQSAYDRLQLPLRGPQQPADTAKAALELLRTHNPSRRGSTNPTNTAHPVTLGMLVACFVKKGHIDWVDAEPICRNNNITLQHFDEHSLSGVVGAKTLIQLQEYGWLTQFFELVNTLPSVTIHADAEEELRVEYRQRQIFDQAFRTHTSSVTWLPLGIREGWLKTFDDSEPTENAEPHKTGADLMLMDTVVRWWDRVEKTTNGIALVAERTMSMLDVGPKAELIRRTLPERRNAWVPWCVEGRLDDRTLYLTDLVDVVFADPKDRYKQRKKLVELGFVGALTAEWIREFRRADRGWNGPMVKETLRALRKQLETPDLTRRDLLQNHAARQFAQSIGEFCFADSGTTLDGNVQWLGEWLDFLGSLDRPGSINLQTAVVVFLALSLPERIGTLQNEHVADEPALANMITTNSISSLWRGVAGWAQRTPDAPRRQPMVTRTMVSVLQVWCQQFEPKTPDRICLFPLLDSMVQQVPPDGPIRDFLPIPDPQIHHWLIASAAWDSDTRDLLWHRMKFQLGNEQHNTVLTWETITQIGVDSFLKQRDAVGAMDMDIRFIVNPTHPQANRILTAVPLEAFVLRLPSDHWAQTGTFVANAYDALDGRVATAFRTFAEQPGNHDILRKTAYAAAFSPWRMVRDDPATLLGWVSGAPYANLGITTLDDLRGLLNEPADGLAGLPISNVLPARVKAGGVWHTEVPPFSLLFQVSEIPGDFQTTAVLGLMTWDDDGYDTFVSHAWTRLAQHDEHPIGRVTRDLFWIRAASLAPGTDAHRAADWTTKIRLAIETILEAEAQPLLQPENARGSDVFSDSSTRQQPPPPIRNQFAETEPALVRWCEWVVDILAQRSPGPRVSIAESLWLTWRLYSWWMAQWAYATPEARAAALNAVKQHDPGSLPQGLVPLDVLAPRGFSSEHLRFRLLWLLKVIRDMEDPVGMADLKRALVRSHSDGQHHDDVAPLFQTTDRMIPSILSSRSITLLLQLAQLPLTEAEEQMRMKDPDYSCLGWGFAATVPDLALGCLLSYQSDLFLQLGTESRRRWIQSMAGDPTQGERVPTATGDLLIQTAIEHWDRLDDQELSLWYDYYNTPAESERRSWLRRRLWVFLMFSGYLEWSDELAHGIANEAIEVGQFDAVAELLRYLAERNPDKLLDTVQHWIRLANEHHQDGSEVLVALAPAFQSEHSTAATAARRVFLTLIQKPPLATNEKLQELKRLVQIKEPNDEA